MADFFKSLMEPGVHFIVVRHDQTCPGASGDPDHCNCAPELEVVDEAKMTEICAADAKARRAAAKKGGAA